MSDDWVEIAYVGEYVLEGLLDVLADADLLTEDAHRQVDFTSYVRRSAPLDTGMRRCSSRQEFTVTWPPQDSALLDPRRWLMQDAAPLDPHPDRCWRCNARPASDDVGLCGPCHTNLRSGPENPRP